MRYARERRFWAPCIMQSSSPQIPALRWHRPRTLRARPAVLVRQESTVSQCKRCFCLSLPSAAVSSAFQRTSVPANKSPLTSPTVEPFHGVRSFGWRRTGHSLVTRLILLVIPLHSSATSAHYALTLRLLPDGQSQSAPAASFGFTFVPIGRSLIPLTPSSF